MTVRHWHWLAGLGLVTAALGGGCGKADDGVSLGDDGRELGGAGAAPVTPTPVPDERVDPPAAPDGETQPPTTRQDGPPGPPDAEGCTTLIDAKGLLCRTCPGEGELVTECLPCQSAIQNRCLTCVDPKGHEAIDCSLDYEIFRTSASLTHGSGDTFNSCSTSWGLPGFSETTCHYPGPDTCTVAETDDARCVSCTYPDGSGKESCLFDPSDPLPDPLAGRPAGLPAPGECLTEPFARYDMLCVTCTHADGSSVQSCRHPETDSCSMIPSPEGVSCAACAGGPDGRIIPLCDPVIR